MTEPKITVHKVSAIVPVSVEMLLDAGAITEAEAREQGWTPPPPMPWRRKMRWRFQEWRQRFGRSVGGWIAGVDLREREDDW